jgi:hypothetical protein
MLVAAYWLSAVLDDGRSVLDDAGASANRRFGTQLLHWELLWKLLAFG